MRLLIRVVAVIAAASVLGTLWFIAGIAGAPGLRDLAPRGLLGALTFVGWAVTLVAGPVAAVQLWRFRESGRRAAIILFGYGFAYYVVGYVAVRSPQASGQQVLLAAVMFLLPLGVLLLRRTRALFNSQPKGAAV